VRGTRNWWSVNDPIAGGTKCPKNLTRISFNLHTKVHPPSSKPFACANMVDIVSYIVDLLVRKDDKA